MSKVAPVVGALPTRTLVRGYNIQWDSTIPTGIVKGEYGTTVVT
jgi:hypothetical protein